MKRSEFEKYEKIARQKLAEAGIPILPETKFRIATYGYDNFEERGMALVTRINEPEYCSKWLVLLPGQTCPEHHHKRKKETFFCHSGEIILTLPDKTITLKPGEYYTLEPRTNHTFTSKTGAIVEEVSTHDSMDDSFFSNEKVVIGLPIEND
jgi:D-lyxose ketol-isomerase